MERAGISKVEIERTMDRVRVDIHTARSLWRRASQSSCRAVCPSVALCARPCRPR
jgi:ribosomal protein S3